MFRLRCSPAVVAVAMIPVWLSIMDTTILNVGYDDIVASLGATLDEVSWASTAYMLASIMMLPLTGWLVARFGRKRMYIGILTFFAIGSLLCGFASTAAQLGAFRVLQGIGGGLLGSIGQAILFDAYPDEHRGEAVNLAALLAMVAPVAGPIVGGFILERFSWPMIFFINVPLALFAIWLALGMDLDQKAKSVPGRFSWTTIALLIGALFSLQYVLQSGQRLGWFDSPVIWWSSLAAIVLGALVIAQQMRAKEPMIDLRLFRNRDYTIGCVLSTLAGASNYAVAFIGPLFLQQILGFSPLQVALLTIPATLGMLAGNRAQRYLSGRISLYWILAPSLVLLAVALWYNGVYADMNDFHSITWLRVLQGFAFGAFIIPIGVLAFRSIPKSQVDAASGLFALIRQESGMLGIALTGALVEASQNWYFRRLLLDVPRWPMLLHRGAPARAAIVDAVSRRADVMAYQHMFAVAAVAMLIFAAGITAYGLWERAAAGPARALAQDPA